MVSFNTIIIGGGPAGTGILFKAIKDGTLWDLLEKGLAIIEQSNSLIKGALTDYKINSDTQSETFLECLESLAIDLPQNPLLDREISFMKEFKGKSIPLNLLNDFYDALGQILLEIIRGNDKCKVFFNTTAQKIELRDGGTFDVHISGANNKTLSAKHVLLSTGGRPNYPEVFEMHSGQTLRLDDYKYKIVHSDKIIRDTYQFNWDDKAIKKVIILGGSHSAFSVAKYLLDKFPENFAENSIKIYCKEKPKLFFLDKKDANAAGYLDFTDDDFCPITKRLYRLAGLRMDGRELYMNILGMLTKKKEVRVEIILLSDPEINIMDTLATADAVVLATGYKMNQIPIVNDKNEVIELLGSQTGRWVDKDCTILDLKKKPIVNLFSMGLSTGFIPSGNLGGEITFNGQTNGIWYYQNVLGEIILKQILS